MSSKILPSIYIAIFIALIAFVNYANSQYYSTSYYTTSMPYTPKFYLNITNNVTGNVILSNAISPISGYYTAGSKVNISAIACFNGGCEGSVFAGWVGKGSGSYTGLGTQIVANGTVKNFANITMNANITEIATYSFHPGTISTTTLTTTSSTSSASTSICPPYAACAKPPPATVAVNLSAEINNSENLGYNFTSNDFVSSSPADCILSQISQCNNNNPSQFVCLNIYAHSNVYTTQHLMHLNISGGVACPLYILSGSLSCLVQNGYCVVAHNALQNYTPNTTTIQSNQTQNSTTTTIQYIMPVSSIENVINQIIQFFQNLFKGL